VTINWLPVYLSLKVALFATAGALLAGIPLAWLLARRKLPWADLLASIITLPMVLPPTVLGYYLLLLVGRQSPPGRWLEAHGITLVFTWQAAVLAAAVVALPLVVRSAQAAFEAIDPNLEAAARTLGRTEGAIFFTVTVPLAWRGILAGTVLAFARAMGEFGATLMVAGNIPGRTQTLSIAIYDAVQAGNTDLANALVVLISLVTVAVLFLLGRVARVTRW
jgi:molybdate transport system permease protein